MWLKVYRFAMRVCFAATICAWGYLASSLGSGTAHGAALTDLASSFEPGRPFGFGLSATYDFSYKSAAITRESLPQFQCPFNTCLTTPPNLSDLLAHYGANFNRTQTVPDLLYTEQRHTLKLRADIGIFQDLQLSFEVPLILQDTRQYNLDPNAGYNRCNPGDWSCIALESSTYLDGIYPIEPGDQHGSLILAPPYRGGSGLDMLDTINLSLTGAPVSQRRDPTKPTWVIGIEGQISVGTIMEYDTTRLRLQDNSPLVNVLNMSGVPLQQGWNGVSEGLHRIILRTALSHRFKYADPYFGLWYMYPIPRTGADSPWKNYGFQDQYAAPQQQAGAIFGFEATPLENIIKGHRLILDFRGGIDFHFQGTGYSEAWELLASSNALICDDQTALPPKFNFTDPNARTDIAPGTVTQGTFNPACRAPSLGANGQVLPQIYTPTTSTNAMQRTTASAYYQQPFTGLTVIENYLSYKFEVGITAKLYRHARLRLAFHYQGDQGHVITADTAGTTNYPSGMNRADVNAAINPVTGMQATNAMGQPVQAVCAANRVDLGCPYDWNPAYRAVIDQPGRRYRADDVSVIGGSAMFLFYY